MEIKDLEIEALKINSFREGYVAALNAVAGKLEAEKKAVEVTQEASEAASQGK